MQIIMATRFRLYPNKTQSNLIDETLDCCRFVYNHMLSRNIKVYKRRGEHLSYNDMQNLLPHMKKYLPWLNVDSQALKYACRQLDTAYQKFFKHEAGFPRFHKKNGRQAYTSTNAKTIHISDRKVKIPTIGWMKVKGIRSLPQNAKICYVTVSREPDGKYFGSITYKYDVDIQSKDISSIIGLDYKSDGLYMDSNGKIADMPHWFRDSQAKLACEQRKLSKKIGSRKGEKKSSGWQKQHRKVAKIQKKTANQRLDYLHKLSKELANTYDAVAIEDLNMRAISNKGFGNGKATLDNGYGMFTTMLNYKLENQGKQLIKIDRFYPSSQICSCCGFRMKMPLSVRIYNCPYCGIKIDRDYNAALNIKHEAERMVKSKAA